MDIYEKYGVEKSISKADFLKVLDGKKQLTLRKLNHVFDNPSKEAELKNELAQIEAAELIVKNGSSQGTIATGLVQEREGEGKESEKTIKINDKRGTRDGSAEIFNEGHKYYQEGDYEAALPLFRKAAYLGHADAQCFLGFLYRNNLVEQPKDGKNAKYWYTQASEQGHLWAMNALGSELVAVEKIPGTSYSRTVDGLPHKTDVEEAIKLWTEAAEKGLPEAMDNLGFGYLIYRQDYVQSYRWYLKYKNTLADGPEKVRVQEKIDDAVRWIQAYSPGSKINLEEFKEYATPEDWSKIQAKLDDFKKKQEETERFWKNMKYGAIAIGVLILAKILL